MNLEIWRAWPDAADAVVHFYPDKMMTINQTALCPPDKKRILEKQL